MRKEETIDFATDKVSVLFKKLFFPTLLGMLSVSAVTTIDGIFIGHGVGSHGIAAVNIVIPLLMVLTGIALMLGMGSSVIASINLSRGKTLAARINITQAMLVGTIAGIVPVIAILLFPKQTAAVLGASDTTNAAGNGLYDLVLSDTTVRDMDNHSNACSKTRRSAKAGDVVLAHGISGQRRTRLHIHFSSGLGHKGRRSSIVHKLRHRSGNSPLLPYVFCPYGSTAPSA